MLQLKNIVKDYLAGDNTVRALKGIDLSFRDSEFVSILGPSGCGKTTLLNIVGGLDSYTEGDLIINGKTTKDFKDRDWDSYRNHSVGFVFQTYNLIPHQTVLQNVELSLTLTGVGKAERRERAKKALVEVGLDSQFNKRPSQLSGGQMQRVAIARALVNNPDIILADEPTGALDSETSIQVMEILKKVAENRLVVMVTHNPDLANQYSTRIINMIDGKITGDSNPLTKEETEKSVSKNIATAMKNEKVKKPSMSFWTAFRLSLKNLFTKKGRTALTSFAGSIGIIGIALILSLSQGATAYIDHIQETTLSSYPLSITTNTMSLSSLLQTYQNMKNAGEIDHEKDAVYEKQVLVNLCNAENSLQLSQNDLKSFKAYLETELAKEDSELKEAINGIQYTYQVSPTVYTRDDDGKIIVSDTSSMIMGILAKYIDTNTLTSLYSSSSSSSYLSSYMTSSAGPWEEVLSGNDGELINDLIYEQYDLVYGAWPNEYDEVVLVLDENNEISDMALYSLGLITESDVEDRINTHMTGGIIDREEEVWTYEEICSRDYRVVLNSDCYIYDSTTGTCTDSRDSDIGLSYLYNSAMQLKVVGIIRANPDAEVTMLSGSIIYTKLLTEYVLEQGQTSDALTAQLANPNTDVITGLPFETSTDVLTDEEKKDYFIQYVSELSDEKKANAYINIMCIMDEETLNTTVSGYLNSFTKESLTPALIQEYATRMGLSVSDIYSYMDAISDEELREIVRPMVKDLLADEYAEDMRDNLSELTIEDLAYAFDEAMEEYTDEEMVAYYDVVVEFSTSTYEENLVKMGYVDMETPYSINIYASSFENKDVITSSIETYNENNEEDKEITYTDYVGLIMSSVTTIIDAITYVLIAFVSISLIVSSIMIAVITLISVQERTKEIGILRAIGASKRDVSSMFNAETMIIGFMAGLVGVGMTYLLIIPINIILRAISGLKYLGAVLPIGYALILIGISMALTLIAGIIPSASAAKKDPVVALRTE